MAPVPAARWGQAVRVLPGPRTESCPGSPSFSMWHCWEHPTTATAVGSQPAAPPRGHGTCRRPHIVLEMGWEQARPVGVSTGQLPHRDAPHLGCHLSNGGTGQLVSGVWPTPPRQGLPGSAEGLEGESTGPPLPARGVFPGQAPQCHCSRGCEEPVSGRGQFGPLRAEGELNPRCRVFTRSWGCAVSLG